MAAPQLLHAKRGHLNAAALEHAGLLEKAGRAGRQAGPSVGCNYDPSHMFWQGIDPIAAIRVLGDCIYHVHAKDTQIFDCNLPISGVLDTKSYTDERNRAWIFRTCGYGHGESSRRRPPRLGGCRG